MGLGTRLWYYFHDSMPQAMAILSYCTILHSLIVIQSMFIWFVCLKYFAIVYGPKASVYENTMRLRCVYKLFDLVS